MPHARRLASLCLLVAVAAAATAMPSSADLTSRYRSGQQQAQQLRSQIADQTKRIQGFEGSISSLEGRLQAIQRSVTTQERLLGEVSDQLAAARTRLGQLRRDYARDQTDLAAQLRAQYESPTPTLVNVIVDAGGFNQLVNGIRDLTAIRRSNVQTTQAVAAARTAVQAQAVRLAADQVRQRRATAAVLVERDDVAQLRLSIVDRELSAERARSTATSRLTTLHHTLAHEAAVLDAEAARAQTLSSGGAVAPPSGCANTPFVAHGGTYGFFPAPGTNYTVNEEPIIAARLDQLGRALNLHLIGISGYRSPEHSVEVGGFADDPHTRGEASDTPGVEGVPESTLEQFCLTRPFPGPREADHIQEL
jgi:peptidoglycan hydrolase CwlO-like protein